MTIICPTSLYVSVSNICSVCFLCIKDINFACVYFICVSDKYLLFFLFMSDKLNMSHVFSYLSMINTYL